MISSDVKVCPFILDVDNFVYCHSGIPYCNPLLPPPPLDEGISTWITCRAWVTTCGKTNCAGYLDNSKCQRTGCEFGRPHCRRLE